MKFIDKLISDTNSGRWDYAWNYSNGTYLFKVAKHYLNGMKFTLDNVDKKGKPEKEQTLIFPNGFGVIFENGELFDLLNVVEISLERTVSDSMKQYANGVEVDNLNDENNEDKKIGQ